MIRSIKNKIPQLYFSGISENYKPIIKDDSITVWLKNVIPLNYTSTLITELSFSKVSELEFEITGNIKGFHKIEIQVQNKEKTKSITSNSLLLIVL